VRIVKKVGGFVEKFRKKFAVARGRRITYNITNTKIISKGY